MDITDSDKSNNDVLITARFCYIAVPKSLYPGKARIARVHSENGASGGWARRASVTFQRQDADYYRHSGVICSSRSIAGSEPSSWAVKNRR